MNNNEKQTHPISEQQWETDQPGISKQQWKNEHSGIGWRQQCDICKNSYNYGTYCDKNPLFNAQWRFLDFKQNDIPFFTCNLFDSDKEKEVQLLEKIKKANNNI